jgi:DNA-binding HxlR family transcriptional regulator
MKDKEEIMLNALNHKVRRNILRLIKGKGSATYTQILDRVESPTGRLNYHLKQLAGLIEKTESDEYELTPLGEKAVEILEAIHTGGLDEYFSKVNEVQTRSISPLMKGFFGGGIAVALFLLGFWTFMGYLMYTEGAPLAVWVILAILYAIGVALLLFLITVYRTAPEYIERIEMRLFRGKYEK